MSASVLGHLALGYQWVWNPQRQLAAVQLFVRSDDLAPVDARHLLDVVAEAWSGKSPQLLLSVDSPSLLVDLLQHGTVDSPWLVVPLSHLALPEVAALVVNAATKRQPMLWAGGPGERVATGMEPFFLRGLSSLTAAEALLALHDARSPTRGGDTKAGGRRSSPVVADQVYEGIGSLALAQYCLDRAQAWGVAGWPVEDVIHARRDQAIEPGKNDILRLLKAVDADLAMDRIEHLLAQEPLLAYRFLRYANSAGFGQRQAVESLRHGLMILGLSTLRRWLMEQLTSASTDVDLQPVRHAMVVRAQLMEQLLDAGGEDTLRREVMLCGLLSQIDLLAGEPLNQAIQRVPVSDRVLGAVVSHSGPYGPYLEIAAALEYPAMRAVPQLCTDHGIDIADVNRTLLRVLSQAPTG